jgi:hypothetical protein
VFELPTSDDYNTSDTPLLEFHLNDLFHGTADEIGGTGTHLTGAPPVGTQPTQEQQRAMMEDFHNSAQRAGEALAAAASLEARRSRPEGRPVPSGSATPQAVIGGGRPVGLRWSLSDTAPRAGGRRTRSPSTRPPHVPHPPHDCCREAGGSGEEEGVPGPATTDEAQSYLDLFF